MKTVTNILMAGLLVAAMFSAQRTSAAGGGAAAFGQLKSLVGHWETEKTNRQHAAFDLELAAAGSALMEKFSTVEDGKPVEMITLYYLDGDQLKMTHYCMAGNQPTMRATYAPESKTLTFDELLLATIRSGSPSAFTSDTPSDPKVPLTIGNVCGG